MAAPTHCKCTLVQSVAHCNAYLNLTRYDVTHHTTYTTQHTRGRTTQCAVSMQDGHPWPQLSPVCATVQWPPPLFIPFWSVPRSVETHSGEKPNKCCKCDVASEDTFKKTQLSPPSKWAISAIKCTYIHHTISTLSEKSICSEHNPASRNCFKGWHPFLQSALEKQTTGCPPKKLKYGKPRLGESTAT